MACLVDTVVPCTDSPRDLVELVHNPMFTDLQATLATDCILQSVPYVLVQGQKYGDEPPSGRFSEHDSTNLLIEDATLQAEFRQLAPLNNAKVGELETFYNTQSASIVTHRSDALLSVERKYLPHDQLVNDVDAINVYYNEEQGHLTSRISQSLQLLKCMLPSELAQPGGITKKNKVRQLDAKAVSLMADWYERHMDNPYPTGPEKVEMAERGHVSVSQVKAWFANKRNRSMNTRPKREKQQLQKQLTKIWHHLKAYDPEFEEQLQQQQHQQQWQRETDVKLDLNQNYAVMLDNLADVVHDNRPELRYSNLDYGSIFGDLPI